MTRKIQKPAPPTWTTETRDVASLHAYAKNPRRTTRKGRRDLSESLRRFGLADPLIANPDGELISGHARLAELAAAGTTKVDVRIPSRALSEVEVAELCVRMNRNVAGEWDQDLLKAFATTDLIDWGFEQDELEQAKPRDPKDADPKVDDAEFLNEEWKVVAGDLWSIGEHLLLCGDSTRRKDVDRLLEHDRPLLMVTDPPYGVEYDPAWRKASGLQGGGAYGRVKNDDRANWSAAYLHARASVAYVWHAGIYAADVAQDLAAAGYDIRAQIIWVKRRFAISRGAYHWAHEPCWYAVAQGKTAEFSAGRRETTAWADVADKVPRQPGRGGDPLYAVQLDRETVYAFPASATTVWELPQDKMVAGGHSTQKPVECMARPVRNHGKPGDVVYDPFCGTGTSLVAAQNERRRGRAIELNPAYCAVALQRMKDAFPTLAIAREATGGR